ncbi:hydroxyacylglutathione hydrolase [Kiloniella litopenaei]|uniref:Hydroxyacylglutathione hydrolase n=1 Tax=Kiloniella litopenaei TaxID=1549748 RepID=A0A0M2R816_9PROT|nr:hydroxyacylglutathione hydrolase [Kiloniella litopenaei]KKJ78067.1 hydroxyacylglutathione hydrolase [Kiloniella litopenaei]
MLDVRQIPILSDNYSYLIKDTDTGAVAVIDPGVSDQILEQADELGWMITDVILTHHHYDHIDGLADIKQRTNAKVTGPKKDQHRIDGIDILVDGGDSILFGSKTAKVFYVPGHTLGHIAYWFEDDNILFPGDSLFSLGCGRLFEGTPEMMWQSLQQYLSLPENTLIYSAHEYTLSNAEFSLTVDPENADLKKRVEKIRRLRKDGQPTVPSLLSEELKTNPFLRPGDTGIRKELNMPTATDADVFKEIRKRKDNF